MNWTVSIRAFSKVRVYRLAKEKWILNLSGSGTAGRWNKTGVRVIYTASSLALALLEMLVHVTSDQVPDYMWTSAEVPDDCVDHLHSIPSDPAEHGSRWLETRGGSVALSVPSVIVPEENVLLNPAHTDFSRIVWGEPAPLTIDPRLLKIRSTTLAARA
jgi:RES domain-containing protein